MTKGWDMILDLIQIIRARRDKPLASKLAMRFARGQLLDRATAPLLFVHLCLWGIVIIMGALAVVLIIAAIKFHGAIWVIAIIPLIVCVIAAWVSLRLKAGLDHIRTIAEGYSDSQLDRLFSKTEARAAATNPDASDTAPKALPNAHNRDMTRDAP